MCLFLNEMCHCLGSLSTDLTVLWVYEVQRVLWTDFERHTFHRTHLYVLTLRMLIIKPDA